MCIAPPCSTTQVSTKQQYQVICKDSVEHTDRQIHKLTTITLLLHSGVNELYTVTAE